MCQGTVGTGGHVRAGPVPLSQPGAGSLGAGWGVDMDTLWAAPALGIEHLPGDTDGLRLGLNMGPQMDLAWWSPRQGCGDRDWLR